MLLLLRIHATPILFLLFLFVVLFCGGRVRVVVLLMMLRRIVRPICSRRPISEMRGAATGVHGPRRSGLCGGVRVRPASE